MTMTLKSCVRGVILSLFVGGVMLSGVGECMAGLFNPIRYQLKNGLELLIVPNGVSSVVDVSILYKVGSADDPHDKLGLSHFLEHMMFKGTKNIPSDSFKKIVRRFGGNSNAFTSYDFTVYQTKIASFYLDLILKLEADRMHQLDFSKEEIEREKNVVMEERRSRLENHPFGALYEVILRASYLYHPYGIPVIGYPMHIEAYDFESARAHYDKWYAPNNAVIIICGKVDPEQVKKSIQAYFEKIPMKTLPKRQRPQELEKSGVIQKIVQKNPRSAMVMYEDMYRAPHHSSKDASLFLPTLVLSQLLGGNSTTEFSRYFVEDRKLALSINTSFSQDSLDPTLFGVEAVLNPEVTMDVFKKELAAYLGGKMKEGFTEEEFKKALFDFTSPFAFRCDGNDHAMNHYLGLSCGFDLETLESWQELAQKVTLDDVNKAFQWIFSKNPLVNVEVYPENN